ncbi:hypothetical protein WMY93_032511 [Mugilogobius chulae]|uniref:EGF-like domain-containing protein n=1 Tax=Mugilogobius chulae TaxID=88201 RepID=A0AAW0MR88_9GOBI
MGLIETGRSPRLAPEPLFSQVCFNVFCAARRAHTPVTRTHSDVNECELLSSVCGEAQCVNVDGSFMCVCPAGHEYNVMVAKCQPLPTGKPHLPYTCLHLPYTCLHLSAPVYT